MHEERRFDPWQVGLDRDTVETYVLSELRDDELGTGTGDQ